MSGPKVDHIALAVREMEPTLRFLAGLGLATPAETEEVASDRVRVAMVPLGETRLEVLTTTDADGPVGRFLTARGPGIHHIALRVSGLAEVLGALAAQGVRLIDRQPRPGAGGSQVAFVHPEGTGGVLVELVEEGGAKPFES